MGDKDKVFGKDICNDFIKQWFVARNDAAGRVVVGVEVPPSLVEGGREWPHPSDWAPEVSFEDKGSRGHLSQHAVFCGGLVADSKADSRMGVDHGHPPPRKGTTAPL